MQTEILEKKLRTFEEFKEKILNSKYKNLIAKMILFGSVVEGAPSEDSDIDVLIFTIKKDKNFEDFCFEIAIDIGIKHNEGIEPIILPFYKYLSNGFFIEYIKKHGKEVFSMDEKKLSENFIKSAFEIIDRYEENAKKLFEEGEHRIAVDLAYHAIETMAKVLIIKKEGKIPKKHSGVINRFSKLFVKSGEFPKEYGRKLNRALSLRNIARYGWGEDVKRSDAEEVIEFLKEFREKFNEYIK